MSSPVREELAIANHILAREGVVDAFGHISLRDPDDPSHYLMSRSLSPALVQPTDIICFAQDGSPADGDSRAPYLERFIHGAVYEARPDVGAVIHSHAHSLIPFSVTNTPIRPLIHIAGGIGAHVPVWDIADRFGETSLLVTHMESARDLAQSLGTGAAALMRGHGAVIVGPGIRHAVLLAIALQLNAQLDLQSRQLGTVKYLSSGEIARSPETLLVGRAAERAWDYYASRAKTA